MGPTQVFADAPERSSTPHPLATAMATVALLLTGGGSALAHEDPPGCFETGPAIVVSVFRANGTTGVVGTVSECETIRYRARLQKAQNSDTVCAFSGGTFSLTTPDGMVHVISMNVPCIGGEGPGEGCDPTVDTFESGLFTYVVSPADIVAGFVTATAQYTGGVAHDSTSNTGGVAAMTPKNTPIRFCGDNDLCTSDVCDPAGISAAACSNTPVVCTDNDGCTADVCNPATGLCVFTPNVPCNDQNLCTSDACDPATGTCVATPNVSCPPDADPCTLDPPCDPGTGQCNHPPAPNGTQCPDTDANPCTIPACEAGVCVQSHLDACPEPIDHVQCYEVKPADFPLRTVTAQDQFGTLSLTLRFPHRLCAPANKNGEGVLDPTEHLTGYKTKAIFAKRPNQTIVNQFGTLQLDVVRPELFLVPTAKDGVPLAPPFGDHFTCYKVKRSRGAAKFVARTVMVVDQFQNVTETVIKPIRLCAPANKNGEDPTAPLHPDHLLCYKAKSSTPFGTIGKSIENQFGPDDVTLIHRRELCVPSLTNPSASTTSTTTTSTATTSTTTTSIPGSPSGAFMDGRG